MKEPSESVRRGLAVIEAHAWADYETGIYSIDEIRQHLEESDA